MKSPFLIFVMAGLVIIDDKKVGITMKKLIITFVGLLVILLGGIWGLLFTEMGNDLLRPRIESVLNEKLPVPLKLQTFSILPLDIALLIGKESKITAKGEWSLLSQDLNISML